MHRSGPSSSSGKSRAPASSCAPIAGLTPSAPVTPSSSPPTRDDGCWMTSPLSDRLAPWLFSPVATLSSGLTMALSPSVTDRFTRSVLVELHDAGAKAVSLSLDGATAQSHDSFRGVEGVFEATLEAARTVREVGLRLQINTTVTRGNVLELPRMLKHVLDLGAALWSVFFLVPTGRGKDLKPLSAAEEEEVLHWLHDVSDLVAVKTTEAPHCRRIAIQRAGVDAGLSELDDVFPVGPLRSRLRSDTVELFAGREPR